jgi:LysR family carnitine catabolism transcriptional activator
VCRKNDPLAAPGRATWSDFEGRDFIAMAPDTSVRNITDAAFLQVGLPIEPLFGCSVVANIGQLVMARLGVTALPRLSVLQLDTRELVWRPLGEPRIRRESGIILRTGYSLAPTVSDFLQVFEATLPAQARSGLFSVTGG